MRQILQNSQSVQDFQMTELLPPQPLALPEQPARLSRSHCHCLTDMYLSLGVTDDEDFHLNPLMLNGASWDSEFTSDARSQAAFAIYMEMRKYGLSQESAYNACLLELQSLDGQDPAWVDRTQAQRGAPLRSALPVPPPCRCCRPDSPDLSGLY